MTKWYGSLQNRLEENTNMNHEIKVGDGMTEYFYSDRKPYEVIAVKDQKHVTVRKMDHKHVGDGCMDNRWELISNPKNPTYKMTRRGNYWYFTTTVTSEILKRLESDDPNTRFETSLWLCHNSIDPDKLRQKGKVTKYQKANVRFGHADYYYDYEF